MDDFFFFFFGGGFGDDGWWLVVRGKGCGGLVVLLVFLFRSFNSYIMVSL